MVAILVGQCNSKERFNRLTAINWVQEFINLGGDRLLLFYSEILGAIMHCISDADQEIRVVSDNYKSKNAVIIIQSLFVVVKSKYPLPV